MGRGGSAAYGGHLRVAQSPCPSLEGPRPMKIIVGGVLSLCPFSPGFVWDWLQYAVGFRQLGHDVYYVVEVDPQWCVDSQGQRCPFESSRNRELFRASMERFGM